MKLFRDAIVLVVLILIKIGDIVLLIFSFIHNVAKRVLRFLMLLGKPALVLLSKGLSNAGRFTTHILNLPLFLVAITVQKLSLSVSRLLNIGIRLPKMLPKRDAYQAITPKHHIVNGKRKHKPLTVLPLPFLVKLKYFTAGGIFSFIVIFIPLLFVLFLQDLPSPYELTFQQVPLTTKIYDRNGTLLYQIYALQNRTLVSLDAIPKELQDASIAIEDKTFYSHPGFDLSAIIRSTYANLSGNELQGGSTITQQLIKSALLTPETSLVRKVKEVILAFWTERIYTKKQILEMYFNRISYGGTAWGVEAAADVYFGKHVNDLDLAESAFLAGMPKAPTIYSPFGSTPTVWKKRQKEVLKRMAELGYITREREKETLNEELHFQTPQIPLYAPHFVMYVRDLLVKKYGLPTVERGGLNVVTSLDLKLQEDAQKIVREEVENDASLNLTNGAALVTTPANGDIVAMVGSKDFSEDISGNVNVTTSFRQPGSSIKIVTYGAALSHGFTAASILDDSPITYASSGGPSYSPVNYDGRFHGRVPLRLAFANSFNIPAVKTLNQVGIPTFVALGKSMGVKSWNDPSRYGLSITLGGVEVTMVDIATVYGTVANSGERVDLWPILKVTDAKGNVLEEKKDIPKTRVLDEGVAFILSSILADNKARAWEFGSNSPLAIPGKTVSVKTGTSDNKRDNWTIGYTPSHLVAVWVGNNDNSPMSQQLASGITGAAPIWNKIMSRLLAKGPNEKPKMPYDVIEKTCLGKPEYFIRGTENSVNCAPFPIPSLSPVASPTP